MPVTNWGVSEVLQRRVTCGDGISFPVPSHGGVWVSRSYGITIVPDVKSLERNVGLSTLTSLESSTRGESSGTELQKRTHARQLCFSEKSVNSCREWIGGTYSCWTGATTVDQFGYRVRIVEEVGG